MIFLFIFLAEAETLTYIYNGILKINANNIAMCYVVYNINNT